MNETFADKLNLIIKVLSLSRARLAAELGLDKSVVARWASGATEPSGHNLAQLSALMASRIAGFTALDWDRDLEHLAEMLGVGGTRASVARATPPRACLNLPFMDQILATTALRAKAYEGFYRSTRPYAGHPGHFIHDHSLIRLGADGLMQFKLSTGGVDATGWMLPIQNQLYLIGTEFTGGTLTFAILHGVHSVKAEVLDGLTLTSNHDAGRSPAAAPVVYNRIGDLTGNVEADDAHLAKLAAGNPVAPPGTVPDDLRHHLARDVGPKSMPEGGDWVLRLPLAQSLSSGPPIDVG